MASLGHNELISFIGSNILGHDTMAKDRKIDNDTILSGLFY